MKNPFAPAVSVAGAVGTGVTTGVATRSHDFYNRFAPETPAPAKRVMT